MVVNMATVVSTVVATPHRHLKGLAALNLMTLSPFRPGHGPGSIGEPCKDTTKTPPERWLGRGPHEPDVSVRLCRTAPVSRARDGQWPEAIRAHATSND
jgi:hypothetical protein